MIYISMLMLMLSFLGSPEMSGDADAAVTETSAREFSIDRSRARIKFPNLPTTKPPTKTKTGIR